MLVPETGAQARPQRNSNIERNWCELKEARGGCLLKNNKSVIRCNPD